MKSVKVSSSVVGAILLAAVLPAGATITFTVTPDSLYTGSSLTTEAKSSSTVLTAGADTITPANPATFKLNVGDSSVPGTLENLNWTAGNKSVDPYFTYTYDIYVNGAGGTLTKIGQVSQDGRLVDGVPAKYHIPNTLSLGSAPDSVFQFSVGTTKYDLSVALLGNIINAPNAGNSTSVGVGGTFSLSQVSAVPETSTIVAGAGGFGLLLLGVRAHSKRSTTRIG